MTAWMGIDGGGSNIRVVIVNDALEMIGQAERAETVNPSAIGRDRAAVLIREMMRHTLDDARVNISGVGIGVAGAAAVHSEAWLREVVGGMLPQVFVAPSSDYEIALVGALGERRGILLLSGTGSVAYGVNDRGEALQVGGWGYLLGDEGSGYWIGMEALRTMTRETDGTYSYDSNLSKRICDTLGFARAQDVILWLYSEAPRTREVAALAQIVLEDAAHDSRAAQIIDEAAKSLHRLPMTLVRRLNMDTPNIAFGGGLLMSDNALSRRVCERLNLPARPIPKYSSVVGAALLAKLRKEEEK